MQRLLVLLCKMLVGSQRGLATNTEGCWAEDAERGWRAAQRNRVAFLPGEIRWDRLVSFGKVKAGRDYAWLRWMNCGRLGENKGINGKIWALGKKDGFLLDQISRRASQEEEKGLENCF